MTADSHAEHSVIESPITEARPNSLLTSPSGDQALTSLSFKGYGNRTRSNPGNESLGYQLLRGKKAMEDCPKAKITAPTDAIIKIVKTTICGTDLHILKGDVQPGRILGHEGIGIVDQVRPTVTAFGRLGFSSLASARVANASIAEN